MITSDSFNRADTAAGTLGTTDAAYGGAGLAWTVTGQLQILSNQVGASTLTTTRWATVDLGVVDQFVEVKMTATTEGGLVVRYTGTGDYFRLRVASDGAAFLEYRVAGSGAALDNTAAGAVVVGDRIGLKIVGSTLTGYVNDVQTLQSTSATQHPSATRAGIMSAATNTTSRYDDFKAHELNAAAPSNLVVYPRPMSW